MARAEQAFDQVQWEITTLAASTTLTMGVYRVDQDSLPGLLFAQTSVDAGSTGGKILALPSALPPGFYWAATWTSGTPTMRGTTVPNPHFITPSVTFNMGSNWNSWSQAGMTGLPVSLAGVTAGYSFQASVPFFMLRLA